MKHFFILLSFYLASTIALAQQNLNSLLQQYHQNINVCNTPHSKSCIYKTNYVRTNISGNNLIIEYGFSYDQQEKDYISHNKIIVNLATALIFTGYWYNSYGDQWQQYGDKAILTIEDKEGIELWITGAQGYNNGTKVNLVESICFSFGSEPLANKVLKEFQLLQNGKRLEPEPWLKPRKVENNSQSKKDSFPNTVKKSPNVKKEPIRPKTISDKYIQ